MLLSPYFDIGLVSCRAVDPLSQVVSGFMESTTRFMHSKTETKGLNYGDVLHEERGLVHAEGE